MAEVTIMIGDRPHTVYCQDGGEARVRMLGQMLDQRWPAALRASGGHNGERALLFVALMLADALEEAERRPRRCRRQRGRTGPHRRAAGGAGRRAGARR